jgi:hypothetical protein
MSASGRVNEATYASLVEQADEQERAETERLEALDAENVELARGTMRADAPYVEPRISAPEPVNEAAPEPTSFADYFFPGREEILATDDVVVRDVYVPEWDRTLPDGRVQRARVRLRSLTGKERDELESTVITRRGNRTDINLANLRARTVQRACVDDAGTLLFTERDVVLLGMKNASAIDRLFSVAQELSGLSDRDVSDLVGNSATVPNGGSGSS